MMAPDTTMEYSIPVKVRELDTKRTYTGWLVKAKEKEIGWFFSTDDKWATDQGVMKIEPGKK